MRNALILPLLALLAGCCATPKQERLRWERLKGAYPVQARLTYLRDTDDVMIILHAQGTTPTTEVAGGVGPITTDMVLFHRDFTVTVPEVDGRPTPGEYRVVGWMHPRGETAAFTFQIP